MIPMMSAREDAVGRAARSFLRDSPEMRSQPAASQRSNAKGVTLQEAMTSGFPDLGILAQCRRHLLP